MATPTSHPRPSPQKSHQTPTASGLSPPPPSSTHSQASKKPLHYRNGSLQHSSQPSPSATGGAGGIAMSRSGTANGTIASTPMARSGTNTSSVGKTPVPVRAGRGMSTSTTSAAGSPSLTAAANLVMQSGSGSTPQAGLGLGLTPLGMGMGNSGLVQGLAGMSQEEQEEERRRRLHIIKDMIGKQAAGFVSQEGVERAARKVGLECLWEEGMGIGDKRVLSIAGSGILVEVEFQGEAVGAVGLSFPASKEGDHGVGRWAKKGSEVLKRDLIGDGMQFYIDAQDFLANLERLAKMDQLGGDDISCFDTVDGIFKSLERIHEWEVSKVNSESKIGREYEVMCIHSGRPVMHGDRRVGLSLQYWKDRRLVVEDGDDLEDMEDYTEEDVDEAVDQISERPWAIMVECEAGSAQLHESIKLSDQWVSNAVERPANQELDALHISVNQIDWFDVKDSGFANGKFPDVRFVARLEPAVLVPLQLALQIHQSFNSPIDQNAVLPVTYEAQLFADIDARNPMPMTPRTIEHTSISSEPDKPQKTTYALFNQNQDFALYISELPFKHPMQIANLLPILRQWVLVSTLLRRCFTPRPPPTNLDSKPSEATNGTTTTTTTATATIPPFPTLEEEFADFLAPDTTTTTAAAAAGGSTTTNPVPPAVEIAFLTTPLPRFVVNFHNPKYGGKLASVSFSIGLNGVFEGVEVDDGRPPVADEEASLAVVQLREKARRVLEVSESVEVAVGWLCR